MCVSLSLQDLTLDTDLTAANGKKVKALEIFTYALQYFKEQALKVRLRDGGSQPSVRPSVVAGPTVQAKVSACREKMWALGSEQ